MMNAVATNFSPSERSAIAMLMDSSVIVKARKEHRAEQAARRKAVRARRAESLTEVQQGIDKAAALMDKESQACQAAFEQLNGARARHRAAMSDWWAFTSTLEAHTSKIERELADLADERCAPVDLWLQTLIQRVRQNTRFWQETQTRMVDVRGTFGLFQQEVSDLVNVSNLDMINAACIKLATCREQLQALVMESDALDIGPDLKRIHAEALDAVAGLVADGSLGPGSVPELHIQD